MPLIEVKLYDYRIDEESTPKIVAALTDALVSVIGESARDGTWVIVDSVPPERWGIGGRVGPVTSREDASSASTVPGSS